MGGLSEGESVELSLREEMVQRALLGELLWLTGHSWQCLCGNLLRIGSLGKQSWVCR